MRRTKIVATLGPASDDPATFDSMLRAGLDVVRLNFSHGDPDDHRRRVEMIRGRCEALNRVVAILGDLQGPKIRITRFAGGPVNLQEGDEFVLDADLPDDAGDLRTVGLTYKELPGDLRADDMLLLDDGRIVLQVDRIRGNKIHTIVRSGGELSNNKGINRQGGGLSAKALTDKDLHDIKLAAELGVDYLAISFPRDAADVRRARQLLREAGSEAALVSKIERAEAVENIDEILEASDVIMIARGDLGVEIGDAELPAVQKRLIDRTRSANRVVITATQMMESMITNPIPTRAEVFDVANAVLDGTDAVMLSGETAAGRFPAKAVAAMVRICESAEQQRKAKVSRHRIDSHFERVDEAVAMAAMYTANHLTVKAIASMTESGSTVLWMSRISSGIPIYALSQHEATRRKVKLYRGVYPIAFPYFEGSELDANQAVIGELKKLGIVQSGDCLIITKGDLTGVDGGTNAMKILIVDAMTGDRSAS